MFCYFCEDGKYLFSNDDQKVLIDCLKLLVSKKIMIGFVFLTGRWKKRRNCQMVKKH